jgi:secreted PhoX family phosphatase
MTCTEETALMVHLTRRALLLAGGALLASDAAAQALGPARLATRADDWLAPGHDRAVVIRWGDPVVPGAPPFAPDRPDAVAASRQFGWDGRIVALLDPPMAADGVPRAVMVVAHPRVDPAHAFPGGRDLPEVAAMAQGASVLNLERRNNRWLVVEGGFQSRRLAADTLCRVSGPAAERIGVAVQGLVGVRGGCATPWGTVLLGEDEVEPWLDRLRGLAPRFADSAGFGWVAEFDPLDPSAVPAKRTALGRFGHGGLAAAISADGRAVVFQTDRRGLGYLFRFVSAGRAAEPDTLDSGVLSVARVDQGRLRWLALPAGPDAALDPLAIASQLGATPFDTPDGLAISPSGRLYVACNGVPGMMPPPPARRSGSPFGQVLEIEFPGGDPAAPTGAARVLVAGGDSQGGVRARTPAPDTTWPVFPSTLTLIGEDLLWIGTDRGGRVGETPDALFACRLSGPERGLPLPLYAAPRAAAIGGAAPSPDGTTLFVMIRTPGAEPGGTFERPGTRWPELRADMPPRSTMIAISRRAGGVVGL